MRALIMVGSIIAGSVLVAIPTSAGAAPARCETTNNGRNSRCYQVLSTKKSTFKVLFTDGLENKTSTPSTLECYVETTASFAASFGYTISGGIKIKLIGDMSAQSKVALNASVAAKRGSRIKKTVPARTVILCDRGTWTYRATIRRTGSNGQTAIPVTTKTSVAPAAVIWRFRQK